LKNCLASYNCLYERKILLLEESLTENEMMLSA
jgi:hypothetical protein